MKTESKRGEIIKNIRVRISERERSPYYRGGRITGFSHKKNCMGVSPGQKKVAVITTR